MGAMKNRRIPFKNKEIECNFTYLYNDDLSLVIDIIRHYGRVVFRGFAVTEHEKRDFSGFFPFPSGDAPFFGESDGNRVKMDIRRNVIEGDFPGEQPISFGLWFNMEDYYFSSTKPGWIDKVPVLNRVYRAIDPTKGVSLLHEDFPLTKFGGNVTFAGKEYPLDGVNGAIFHHWGWYFPNYLFLACNGFSDPTTVLTLAFADSVATAGIGIKSGYLYLHHGETAKNLVSPFKGRVIYFYEEGKISVVARFNETDSVRVNIDPRTGTAFPHVFNTNCVTVVNAHCEVEGVGTSNRAVLDLKGLDVVEMVRTLDRRGPI